MKTIQINIDEPLLADLDQAVRRINITRSAFIHEALQLALQRHKLKEMEQKHAEGYARYPVKPGEFD